VRVCVRVYLISKKAVFIPPPPSFGRRKSFFYNVKGWSHRNEKVNHLERKLVACYFEGAIFPIIQNSFQYTLKAQLLIKTTIETFGIEDKFLLTFSLESYLPETVFDIIDDNFFLPPNNMDKEVLACAKTIFSSLLDILCSLRTLTFFLPKKAHVRCQIFLLILTVFFFPHLSLCALDE